MHSSPHVGRFLLAIAGSVALAASSPAGAAAAGWVTGPPVSAAGGVAVRPMVAIAPSGERVVAWERTKTGDFDQLGLAVRVAPPGGELGDVQLIDDPNESGASLAIGSDGTAALVWTSGTKLHVARRAPGQGAFAEAAPFELGGSGDSDTKVATKGGDVYVTVASDLFTNQNKTETTSIHALRLAAGATAITRLPGTGPGGTIAQDTFTSPASGPIVETPDIAIDGDAIHVVWEDATNDFVTRKAVAKVRRAVGSATTGTFGAPVDVDTDRQQDSSFATFAQVQIAAGGGHVDVVYQLPGNRVAYADVAGAGTPQTVTTTDAGSNLRSAVDPSGNLVLAWERFFPDTATGVVSTTVPPGAAPGPVTRLTPANAQRRLDGLAVGPDGSVAVFPNRTNSNRLFDSDVQLQAAFRPAGGGFGGLEEVSGARDRTTDGSQGADDRAAGAIGPDGRAIVAWGANDVSGTLNERIFVSERDATPPVISALSVPDTALPGASVAMAAAASDTQTGVATTWDFGDGSQASGTTVAHAYGETGTFTVTVTATDAVGNSTSATRTLVVATPPSPPGATGPPPPDRTPPVVTALKSKNPRFRVTSAATAQLAAKKKAKKAPAGTTLSLRLSERATLVFSFTGKEDGRREGKRCVAGGKKGAACRIAVTPPPFIRGGRGPGAVSVPYSGRVGGATLKPGAYTASVTAIDAAGNRSRPATVKLTVVAR